MTESEQSGDTNPKFLVREPRVFKVARLEKEGKLELTGSVVLPSQLSYFGSQEIIVSLPRNFENEAREGFYLKALNKAKEVGVDFIFADTSSQKVRYSSDRGAYVGVVDFFLINSR